MRLAEKHDNRAEGIPPDSDKNSPGGKSLVVYAEKPKAPPPASLSANLIQRRNDNWGGIQVEQLEQQAMPQASEAVEAPRGPQRAHQAQHTMPEAPGEPIGARAQQAILEQAFEELEPVAATSPIERSEFQSARDSAAHWSLRRSPSGSYWERVIKDVSIFTIVFAVLVLAILQAM